MLRVMMITSNKFPIPTVLGGSVETLIQYLVDENMKKQRIKLKVYSIDDPLARKVYDEQYKGADIVYIKRTRMDVLWEKWWFITRLSLKLFKRILFSNPFTKKVYSDLKSKDFDFVVFEGNYYEKGSYICEKIDRRKMIIHWHQETAGNSLIAKLFSKHICISNYTARFLSSSGHVRFEDVIVLRNCANLELFSQPLTDNCRDELLKSYGFQESDFIISFIGRLIPEKGVRELLLAFKEVCRVKENCKLLIIGSSNFGYDAISPYQEELISLAGDLKDKIVFTGYLHHDEMWKSLKLSEVSVFPSVCNEGAGMVGLEVMAASVPLITTNVGGIPEYVDVDASIVIDWDKDFVRNLSDSIIMLMDDEEKRDTMKQLGYEHVQQYSVSKYYDDFCDLLDAVYEENRKDTADVN